MPLIASQQQSIIDPDDETSPKPLIV